MGSSFTPFRGHGFWCRDACIELWLFLLAREVKQISSPPEWLQAAAEDWQIQATAGFTGCVSAGLDEHVVTSEKVAVVLALSEQALTWLRGQGEVLPVGLLNSFGLGGPGSCFTGDVPVEMFVRVGEAFVRLLRDEIAWDAVSSPLL